MADRYGDDMQFKEMMEKMDRESSGIDISPAGSSGNMKVPERLPHPKRVVKVPVGCSLKELNKNSWEYWDKCRNSTISIQVEVEDDTGNNKTKQPDTTK